MQLVFIENQTIEDVAVAMVAELETWLKRYPVPIMVFAFDDTGQVLKIEPVRSADHVTGWLDSDGRLVSHWRLLKNEEIPSQPFTIERLLSTYPDMLQKTSTAQEKAKDFEDCRRPCKAARF